MKMSNIATMPFLWFLLASITVFGGTYSVDALADSITPRTYKKLIDAQELLAEENVDDAILSLKSWLDELDEDSLDKALTLQTLGYAEMSKERFEVAIGYLRASLDTGKLPESVKYNVGYMVAQLHAALGEYDQALSFAEDWFVTLEAPSPTQFIFMANAYAQTGRFEAAIPYAESAIRESSEPRENWYQLVVAAHFKLENYAEAAENLRTLVTTWPEKISYWEQLASTYIALDEEEKAFAVLRLAWLDERIEKESTLKSMAQLALSRGVPEHAAMILEAGFARRIIDRNASLVGLQARAWAAAKEYEEAIRVYRQLAKIEDSGEPLLKATRLYLEMEKWSDAELAILDAMQAGIEKSGEGYLMLGMALAEQNKFEQSFDAFGRAANFDDTKRRAKQWLRYSDGLFKQQQWRQSFGRE
jgi:tetratricopeptide (TPR) repeat protein